MSKESERIKKSHFTAMACLGVKEKDKETEQAIEIVEKREKALEIIKEKRVDVGWLINCENIEQYNNVIGTATHKLLTKKEYNLLKEVLL